MASAFGHALTAIAIGKGYPKKMITWKFWFLGAICAIIPDADVITFKFGIPYESFWGHRGFSHSFLFALLLGILVTVIFYRKKLKNWQSIGYILYFSLCTASHSILDAMTTGGLGVAFFSPWDNTRYFFPWRPIKVSPIGVENFFSEWGVKVILSELIWIGIPCLTYIFLMAILKRNNTSQKLKA
ncbi:metal-dependent hydrolase [Limibacter armeniacum]|uniref:metal-dependent hydrolase n=1 Tax=Limibacter armeniacum TaxID=466084 RepID=UPI002FE572F2